MIHIVFNEADVAKLQEAISLDESLTGDIIQIKDDYAVGPIEGLYEQAGKEARKDFWRKVLKGSEAENLADSEEVDDYKTIASIVGGLRREEIDAVWIWAAQNKHDVSGYYWLLHYLREFQGKIFILYLNNLPFINDKGGIFYPDWLSEIPAREFLKAKKLAREITTSEFEVDGDEWDKYALQQKMVRILEGGKKLVQYDADFYDKELSGFLTYNWQKLSKIFAQFFAKAKHTTGDMYLWWRLNEMKEQGVVEIKNDSGKWKDVEIKRAGKSDEAALPEEEKIETA